MFNPKYFVLFIGYPRSGHSFISSVIDSHKNAIISTGTKLLMNYRKLRFNKNEIFSQIIKNSRKNAKFGDGRRFKYLWKNSYQGKYTKLCIIGDKKIKPINIILSENDIQTLKDFQNEIKLPIKFIHVIRNPFDMIVSNKLKSNTILDFQIDKYNLMFSNVDLFKNNYNYDILDIYYEDFLLNPGWQIRIILNFLELKNYSNFIKLCKGVTFSEPRKTRLEYNWNNYEIQKIDSIIKKYDFISRYNFDD